MSPNARRSMEIVLCSDCFQDPGLRMAAQGFGVAVKGACPVCRSDKGTKLDKERVAALARSFFVWGTMLRCDYGAAPVVQFNELQKTSIGAPPWLGLTCAGSRWRPASASSTIGRASGWSAASGRSSAAGS